MVEGEDDGIHLVKSRGLVFVPCAITEIPLEQGLRAPITEVISRAFTILRLQDCASNPALDWMKASFTSQADGTYYGHICTRRDPQRVEFTAGSYRGNALLAHLWSTFPGHFLPNPGANAERKEERVEWRAGEEASTAAGGAGAHVGTCTEGRTHSASVGAVPFPARQTAIAWPVVGDKGDRALQISDRGSGTRRAALVPLSPPPGVAAMAPVTSGPP